MDLQLPGVRTALNLERAVEALSRRSSAGRRVRQESKS
jgi:hypothetical protein